MVLAYQEAVTALAIRVLRAFAAALDQPEDVFEPIYTPEAAPAAQDHPLSRALRTATARASAPTRTSGFVTVLLQDEQAGLQVQGEDGGWIDAPPIEGTFVINIGEILELASNGYPQGQRAPRGVAARERRAAVDRLLPRGAARRHGAGARPRRRTSRPQAGGLTQDPLNPLFHEVGRNYLKGRLRSHPDVAQRHHADLLDPAAGTLYQRRRRPTTAAA